MHNSWDNYRRHILEFGAQFRPSGIILANTARVRKGRYDGIVIAGMGGSGLPASILKGLAESLKLPVSVIPHKAYGLPGMPLKNPLVVCVSFSGVTAETVSAFKAARAKHREIAVVAGGGELLTLAHRAQVPFATFNPGDLTPRAAIGYTYTSVKKLLQAYYPSLHAGDLSKVIHSAAFEREGKMLASKLKGKIPLIYTDHAYAHAGYVWKINLNETAKTPAFAHTIPEMVHNEIAGFETASKNFLPLFVLDPSASPEVKKKTKIVRTVLGKWGFKTLETTLKGGTPEIKTMQTIALSHWTALYLAKLLKKDPISTTIIEDIKVIARK